tara:strand:+ start:38 stop:601 length:564 start_codon:yes stop_codon:yes gene_type:complete
MAKKETTKNVLERVYNVPLRKEYQKAPNWKRTPKAVKALRQFIVKHMKSENVIIGRHANNLLWKDGIKKPPHHVKVNAVKDEKGKVTVELVELPGKAKREESKLKEREKKAKDKEAKKDAKPIEKIAQKLDEKKGEEKSPEEVKKEQDKEKQKEEIKELKKELPKQAPKPAPQQRQVEQRPTAPKSQ